MNFSQLLFLFGVLCCFISCSKDIDNVKPTVIINAPGHLFQVDGIDTIQVLASISDDKNIESVTVSVRDENDIDVLGRVTKRPDAKEYDLNISYFFDNIQLAGGEYQLSVRAFDGENTTTKYVTIYYNDLPRIREGVFVVSNSLSMTSFYSLDQNYSSVLFETVQGDHLKTIVDSYNQQLIHVSNQPGSISTVDLLSNSLGWSLNPTPLPRYTGFFSVNQNLYLGLRNGGIKGYDRNGNINFSSPLVHPNFSPKTMHFHTANSAEYLVAEERSILSNSAYLAFYFMTSGSLDVQRSLSSDLMGIYSKGNDVILLANNSSGIGEVLIYNFANSVINPVFSPNVNEIEDCFEIECGVYLVAEGGNLSIINTNTHQKTAYLNNIGAKRIWYDDLTNELYVSNGNALTIYDFPSKMVKHSNYVHHSEIKEVVFWYNK